STSRPDKESAPGTCHSSSFRRLQHRRCRNRALSNPRPPETPTESPALHGRGLQPCGQDDGRLRQWPSFLPTYTAKLVDCRLWTARPRLCIFSLNPHHTYVTN